ncbi:MAG: hypothetical protein ABIG09_03610 [bacterium]
MIEKFRDILRQKAPLHKFNPEEKEEVKQLLQKAKETLGKLEESI